MKEKVLVENLSIGMFVCELDRPWLDTPFLFQGFPIENSDQVQDLRAYCRFVFIDPARGAGYERPPPSLGARRERPSSGGVGDAGPSPQELDELCSASSHTARLLAKLRTFYPDLAAVEEELPVATTVHKRAAEVARGLFSGMAEKGTVDGAQLEESIEEMAESIVRNPDALLLLTYLRNKSVYAYDHSLSVSIHLLAFGRHMGLPKTKLHVLGGAGMLLDVGMARLPDSLLGKQGSLSAAEYEAMKRHVHYGVEIIRGSSGIAPHVAEIVAQHHERENGSGYPGGLVGREISLLGRMAAIVDCFAALISERPYAQPTAPFEALQMLYNWRKEFYHEDLVEQFIQCLGAYPVGSLVRLNTGEVAVVLAHNRVRRLKPRVMVILDADEKPYHSPMMLDLLNDPKAFDGQSYEIRQSLAEGACEVDLTEFYL